MSGTAQTTDSVEQARQDGLRAQAAWFAAEEALREAIRAGRPAAEQDELNREAERTYQDNREAHAEWEYRKRRAAEQHGTA